MRDPEFCFIQTKKIIMGDDKLDPYPGNLKHHKVEETKEMRDKRLREVIENMKQDSLTGHSLSDLDDGVFCFINEEFPVIATASRVDLSVDDLAHGDKRYPIVHAIISRRECGDGQSELYVRFEELISVPMVARLTEEGERVEYKCPHVDKVRMELIKFVHDTFKNRWRYKIGEEFFTVSDMRGTLMNSKYVLLPSI